MYVAELFGKLNRRNKAALCGTVICVGLLLLSHLKVRPVLGITLLGIAYAWALGSNSRLVHWLFLALGLLLLTNAAVDGYFWPATQGQLIKDQTSIIESERSQLDEPHLAAAQDLERARRAVKAGDLQTARVAHEMVEQDLSRANSEEHIKLQETLLDNQMQLARYQHEGLLRRELEVDLDSIAGGLLLFSSGLGLLIGVRSTVHSCMQTPKTVE